MRPRDISFSINARTKELIINQNQIDKNIPENDCKQKIEEATQKNIDDDEMNENTLNLVNFPIPQYKGAPKDFSKKNKPIKINEKGYLSKLDPDYYEYIPKNNQNIEWLLDLDDKNNNEINGEMILGIQFEKYNELAQKLDQFGAAAGSSEYKNEENYNEVIAFLQRTQEEIEANRANANVALCNIDKIDRIEYGDKTQIFMKK